jgi:hypothetical protein
LLLIDHEDFQELDHGYKERIAPTELVQQLIDMGLLAHQQPESIHIEEEVTSEENNTSTKISHIQPDQNKNISNPAENLEAEIITLEKLPLLKSNKL